jgi:cholesterol oxidase
VRRRNGARSSGPDGSGLEVSAKLPYGSRGWITRGFHEDPIYKDIEKSLEALEPHLRADYVDNEKGKFRYPFLSDVFGRFKVDSITLTHPLGGCRMAEDAENGVVDEYGRVFDNRKTDQEQRFYDGLYIADGVIIPTALGVNPSLTISALALRMADKISEEL